MVCTAGITRSISFAQPASAGLGDEHHLVDVLGRGQEDDQVAQHGQHIKPVLALTLRSKPH
jgi:hypothetical protein